MRLDATSRLVRWTYYFNTGHRPPARTSLCAFFWRGFVLMPAAIAFVVIGVLGILNIVWQNKCEFAMAVVFFLSIGVFIWSVSKLGERAKTRRLARVQPSTPSVFVQGVIAIKLKVCPIIDIVDPETHK